MRVPDASLDELSTPSVGAGGLAGTKVLDLMTGRGELCGRTLAEFGADVVVVEPSEGNRSRRRPPFAATGSLFWETVGFGKRSVIVDLKTSEGQATIRALASGADVLLESFDPGFLQSVGLGYEDLAQTNPSLVYVSVTPYGQSGPKSGWPATDLTIEAAGGRLVLQRDGDRPPVPVGYPQASFHAGVQAAADTLFALHERRSSGLGQHLDVSMQAVMVHTIFSAASGARLNDSSESVGTMDDPDAHRAAKLLLLPGIWSCADGYVAAPLTAGALPLVAHILNEEPNVDADLRAYDWNRLVADVLRGRIEDEFVLRAIAVVAAFFAARTKAELFALAFAGEFRLGPLQTTRDLLDDPHLQARNYWTQSYGLTRPGAAVRLSGTPMETELPFAREPGTAAAEDVVRQWATSRSVEGGGVPATGRTGEAFAGLKVADFSWVAVGPTIGRAFADHGATVVRVESERRVDVARTLAPWKGAAKGINDSNWYAHYNAGKLGLALDLSQPEGRDVARRLIDWADVVIESFSPGTMARFGLDYETVSQTNPGVIMMSTSLLGQSGPMSSFAGFGQQAVGLCGISTITGWPDRPPIPPMGAYTDVVAPKYGIAAIAAALLARGTSGLGQHLDMSQVEASMRFIEPLLLDEAVNSRTAVRRGSASDNCPESVYGVAGHNRFIAIGVDSDEQWRALRQTAAPALDDFAADLDLAGREAQRDEIDAAIAGWTADRDGEELEARLSTNGVPAARAAKPAHVARDPQLEHRGYFVPLDHSAMGRCDYEAPATIFSAKRTVLHRAAPCLGEHTEQVLREHLGLEEAEVARLQEADVLR